MATRKSKRSILGRTPEAKLLVTAASVAATIAGSAMFASAGTAQQASAQAPAATQAGQAQSQQQPQIEYVPYGSQAAPDDQQQGTTTFPSRGGRRRGFQSQGSTQPNEGFQGALPSDGTQPGALGNTRSSR